MTLSLSPRFDAYRFALPKGFLPKEVEEKYRKIINKNAGVIYTPIDYLNESIQSLHLPGLSGATMEQPQHESNPIHRSNGLGQMTSRLGRINVEPQHDVVYESSGNPLSKIDKEFKISFRLNQGLYNYYMLYETVFYHMCKHLGKDSEPVLYVDILNDEGVICSRVFFKDCHIEGMDGLDFNYDKTNRDVQTFDVTFKFNNIDFEFIECDE